jgi:uncharacterized protein involved in outer membrane biogenesis
MRWIKYGAIALVVVVVALVVVVATMDLGRFKGYAEEAAMNATGRKLTIDGELHLSLLPAPTLSAEKVRFANAPGGSSPDMVKVDKVEARVALMPLLSQDIVVERLALISPEILLETDKSGKGNWEFTAPAPAPAPTAQTGKPAAPGEGATPSIPVLNDITIEKGRLVSKDGKSGKTQTLALDKLNVKGAGSGVPLKIELSGAYDEKKFDVAGTLGSLADLSGPKPWPVDVTAKAGGATATVKGTIAKPMEAKGVDLAITAEGKDLEELGKAAGAALPALGAYKLAAHVTGPGGEGWAVKDLNLALGKTTLTGTISVDPDKTPLKVVAKLDTPELDLAALSGGSSAKPADNSRSAPATTGAGQTPGAAPRDDGRLFPADPLPLDTLKSVDADVTVNAKRIVKDQLALTDASLHAVIARGKLTVQPLKAGVAGGTLDAKATVDGGAATPEVAIEANGKDIDLNTLMTQLGNPGMIEAAKGAVHADLKGRGKSVREIMASLDGSLALGTGAGRLGPKALDQLSADIVKLLAFNVGSIGQQQAVTQINCVAVPFTVQAGLAKSDAILVDTGKVTVKGSGTASLRDEKLDLVFTPTAKEGGLMSYAAVPVHVTGTFASPSVAPDAAGAVKNVAGAAAGVAVAGPLALLAPLVTGGGGEQNPCVSGAAAKGTSQPQPATQQKPQTPQDAVRGKIDDVGKSIRGLFGR